MGFICSFQETLKRKMHQDLNTKNEAIGVVLGQCSGLGNHFVSLQLLKGNYFLNQKSVVSCKRET